MKFFGDVEQPFGCIGSAIEHHVFASLTQFGLEIVINRNLAGIDDAQVHSSLDGVKQEHRVHGLPHPLVATERKRQVRDTTGYVRMRKILADPARPFDKVDAVAVVLFHAGRNGEDIRIKDNILRRKADLIDQDVVSALADRCLAFKSIGLALLVERHHHHGRTIAANRAGMFDECSLAFFHRYRVHDGLALHALETGLDDRKFRRIDHHGYARDVGLGSNEIEERRHRLLRIEQAFVHVDVDHLGAVFHLFARYRQRCRIVASGDQFSEFGRARNVRALAHIHEWNFRGKRERFESRQP